MKIAVILLSLAFGVHAETLIGYVVGIADGDAITVPDTGRQQHKIHLAGIDTPECLAPICKLET